MSTQKDNHFTQAGADDEYIVNQPDRPVEKGYGSSFFDDVSDKHRDVEMEELLREQEEERRKKRKKQLELETDERETPYTSTDFNPVLDVMPLTDFGDSDSDNEILRQTTTSLVAEIVNDDVSRVNPQHFNKSKRIRHGGRRRGIFGNAVGAAEFTSSFVQDSDAYEGYDAIKDTAIVVAAPMVIMASSIAAKAVMKRKCSSKEINDALAKINVGLIDDIPHISKKEFRTNLDALAKANGFEYFEFDKNINKNLNSGTCIAIDKKGNKHTFSMNKTRFTPKGYSECSMSEYVRGYTNKKTAARKTAFANEAKVNQLINSNSLYRQMGLGNMSAEEIRRNLKLLKNGTIPGIPGTGGKFSKYRKYLTKEDIAIIKKIAEVKEKASITKSLKNIRKAPLNVLKGHMTNIISESDAYQGYMKIKQSVVILKRVIFMPKRVAAGVINIHKKKLQRKMSTVSTKPRKIKKATKAQKTYERLYGRKGAFKYADKMLNANPKKDIKNALLSNRQGKKDGTKVNKATKKNKKAAKKRIKAYKKGMPKKSAKDLMKDMGKGILKGVGKLLLGLLSLLVQMLIALIPLAIIFGPVFLLLSALSGIGADPPNIITQQTAAALISVNTDEMKQIIEDKLTDEYDDVVVAGIMGNIEYVSGYNPFALEYGIGIVQWNNNDKLTALEKHCKDKDFKIENMFAYDSNTDFSKIVNLQMDFLINDLKTNFSSLLDEMRNLDDSEEGAKNAASLFYEKYMKIVCVSDRPSNLSVRQDKASLMYLELLGQRPTEAPTEPPTQAPTEPPIEPTTEATTEPETPWYDSSWNSSDSMYEGIDDYG